MFRLPIPGAACCVGGNIIPGVDHAVGNSIHDSPTVLPLAPSVPQGSASRLLLSSVQSLSCVRLFANSWTAARQASLSLSNSWSLLKLKSIASVMPSNHLIFCRPFSPCLQSFPASESFPVSQFFPPGGQSIGASASAPIVSMNIQGCFPL